MLREGERQRIRCRGCGEQCDVSSGVQPQALGCYLPWLINPTQLGWFVDSTPLGGAGGRKGVEVEGRALGPAEGRPF